MSANDVIDNLYMPPILQIIYQFNIYSAYKTYFIQIMT